MRRARLQLALVLAVLITVSAHAPASAQEGWSWIVTPQLWGAHIEKNGFTPSSTLQIPLFDFVSGTGAFDFEAFRGTNSQPVDSLYPQWGLQVAAQKNRWTLAGSFQYVSFETRTDLIYDRDAPAFVLVDPLLLLFAPDPSDAFQMISPGERVAQEFVDTTRIDIDLAASYAFPDVVSNRLDLSIGAGLKLIYAEASREYTNMTRFVAVFNALDPPGLYLVCPSDDCSDAGFRQRVKTRDYLYGGTIPMNATIHLTNDSRWLLPVSITPFLGAETRDDRDVVYKLELDPSTSTGVKVDRLDGTTFAYGVTGDVTLRYLLSDMVSVYGGGRVQYIKGHEDYLAYGPIVGMSVRFGGR